MYDRRKLLKMSGLVIAASALGPSALAQAPSGETSLEDMIEQELAQSEAEPYDVKDTGTVATWQSLGPGVLKAKTAMAASLLESMRTAYEKDGAEKLSTWPSDVNSIDYAHLVELGKIGEPQGKEFELTHDVLSSIASANEYTERVVVGGPRVVFGLRGCGIIRASGQLEESVRLIEQQPDHFRKRCVIGVWDRIAKTVAVFPGSTVPNRAQMELFWLWSEYEAAANKVGKTDPGQWATNLLPQGIYQYVVGTHLARKKRTSRQPGVLRLQSVTPVLRARTSAAYTHGEFWDYANKSVGDNIHATVFRNDFLEYSSQGCQTVYGWYDKKGETPQGALPTFRSALGLGAINVEAQTCASDGQQFWYMLTTGREARIHHDLPADASRAPLYRVRFNSKGPRARAVQDMLKVRGAIASADGNFGRLSTHALLDLQKGRPYRDGAVTPSRLGEYGIQAWQ